MFPLNLAFIQIPHSDEDKIGMKYEFQYMPRDNKMIEGEFLENQNVVLLSGGIIKWDVVWFGQVRQDPARDFILPYTLKQFK